MRRRRVSNGEIALARSFGRCVFCSALPDWSFSRLSACDTRLVKVDRSGKEVAEPLESRLGTVEQGLDMRRRLVESPFVLGLGQRHLDGDGVQAPSRRGSRFDGDAWGDLRA